MLNQWRSWDTADPIAIWTLELPLERPEQRFDALRALCQAGDESGVFTLQQVALPGLPFRVDGAADNGPWAAAAQQHDLAEIFPFEQIFMDHGATGGSLSVLSTVSFVLPGQGIVTERRADAGQLLRELDPGCDPLFAERFYARGPFVALWSATSADVLRVSFGFWCDLWFDDGEPELLRLNGERLQRLRDRLDGLAGSRRGRLDLTPAR
ncbi:MAG: hypothetical protein JXR83_19640 [Deltaproteobacteria bacterium]|nr:hypothetical protein [Deltaproteobacteria bacterium]